MNGRPHGRSACVDLSLTQQVEFKPADHRRLDAVALGILEEQRVLGALHNAGAAVDAPLVMRECDLALEVPPPAAAVMPTDPRTNVPIRIRRLVSPRRSYSVNTKIDMAAMSKASGIAHAGSTMSETPTTMIAAGTPHIAAVTVHA
jgi:hypothetical protein